MTSIIQQFISALVSLPILLGGIFVQIPPEPLAFVGIVEDDATSIANSDVTLATTETLVLDKIAIAQAAYLSKNGRYYQGIKTHTIIPSTDTIPNNLSAKPFYQKENWVDFNAGFPATLPFSISITQYETPKGEHGYEVIFERIINGVRLIKRQGYGVEAAIRTTTWYAPDF